MNLKGLCTSPKFSLILWKLSTPTILLNKGLLHSLGTALSFVTFQPWIFKAKRQLLRMMMSWKSSLSCRHLLRLDPKRSTTPASQCESQGLGPWCAVCVTKCSCQPEGYREHLGLTGSIVR